VRALLEQRDLCVEWRNHQNIVRLHVLCGSMAVNPLRARADKAEDKPIDYLDFLW
jgi:hypothetical protein